MSVQCRITNIILGACLWMFTVAVLPSTLLGQSRWAEFEDCLASGTVGCVEVLIGQKISTQFFILDERPLHEAIKQSGAVKLIYSGEGGRALFVLVPRTMWDSLAMGDSLFMATHKFRSSSRWCHNIDPDALQGQPIDPEVIEVGDSCLILRGSYQIDLCADTGSQFVGQDSLQPQSILDSSGGLSAQSRLVEQNDSPASTSSDVSPCLQKKENRDTITVEIIAGDCNSQQTMIPDDRFDLSGISSEDIRVSCGLFFSGHISRNPRRIAFPEEVDSAEYAQRLAEIRQTLGNKLECDVFVPYEVTNSCQSHCVFDYHSTTRRTSTEREAEEAAQLPELQAAIRALVSNELETEVCVPDALSSLYQGPSENILERSTELCPQPDENGEAYSLQTLLVKGVPSYHFDATQWPESSIGMLGACQGVILPRSEPSEEGLPIFE